MSAHNHYTNAAAHAACETKDIGAMIVTTLISAGVLVPAAWLGSMMARDLVNWLDNAIDTVRDAITHLRFGTEMDELSRIIDTLQAAGVQVPAQVRAIVDNPITGDAGSGPALNLEYARGWLETTLRLLQEAQDRAESMPDEQRSDPTQNEDKGDVIYGMFGSGSEESGSEGGEPGDVSDFFSQAVSEVEGTSTTLDNMYEAYVEWCQSRGFSPVPPEAFKREMLGMGIMRQYIAGRDRWLGVTLKSISVKAAGAHHFYR